jgi:ubiquinone/menaquinone biosynthesis C-methylase UbiE
MAAPETATEIRDVNTRYHDAAADEYDHKWGIDFHEIGRQQVLGKVTKLLGSTPGPFERGLEIGAGTGYFAINLVKAGVIRSATCTDISPGMLATLERNAAQAGVGERVDTEACDAEQLPFADGAFDLVFGHAVLHHIPDLGQAFREFHRVLRPGGTLFFAGEPSREGDKIAVYPKRGAMRAAPVWRRLMGAQPAPHVEHPHVHRNGGHELEGQVDVHTFVPSDLRELAGQAGFEDVKVRGEELLANWFGWANRTLESTAAPDTVPWLWRQYAYRGYLALQRVDRALLEPRLPPAMFYNLMLAARKR